jgi:hypothetical protein
MTEKYELKQIGFFVKPSVKAKLQSLAMENNRTLSGQLVEMINSEYKKMLKEQSNLLSK